MGTVQVAISSASNEYTIVSFIEDLEVMKEILYAAIQSKSSGRS